MPLLRLPFFVALCLALSAGVASVRADDSAPPSCATLNAFWKSEAHAKLKISWPLKPFICPSAEATIAETVYVLNRLAADLPYPAYEALTAGLDRTRLAERKGDVHAAVVTGRITGVTLELYPPFFEAALSDRIETLTHEAWHRDPAHAEHVDCAAGASKGKPGSCDAVLSLDPKSPNAGAYSIGLLTCLKLSRLPKARLFGIDPDDFEPTATLILQTNFNSISSANLTKATRSTKAVYCFLKAGEDADALSGCFYGRFGKNRKSCESPKLNSAAKKACESSFDLRGKADPTLYREVKKSGLVNGI